MLHTTIHIHFVLKLWLESACSITNVYFTPVVHNHTCTSCIKIVILMSTVYFTQTIAYNCTHTLHWNCDVKVWEWLCAILECALSEWKHEDVCHCLRGLDGWACFTYLQVTITWDSCINNCIKLNKQPPNLWWISGGLRVVIISHNQIILYRSGGLPNGFICFFSAFKSLLTYRHLERLGTINNVTWTISVTFFPQQHII